MPHVTVVGSANVDVILHVRQHPKPGETVLATGQDQSPGGKGFNQAAAVQRAGVHTQFVASCGADSGGDYLRKHMNLLGLDASYVQIDSAAPTGTAYIVLDETSENSIIVNQGANARLSASAIESLEVGSVLLTQLEVPVEVVAAALRYARAHDALTVLNAAPARVEARDLFAHADIVIVNETEAEFFGGVEAITASVQQGVVLTLGAHGARWIPVDGETLDVPAFPADVVDTTGAGDAFCGAFTAELARGASVEDALAFASAGGALATTKLGAQAGLASEAEIRALVKHAVHQ